MWWTTLTLLQKIFFCIACPASLFLIIQIILMLIGLGSGADVDAEGVDLSGDGATDITVDTDTGLSLFTIKGLTAFFSIAGWVGFIFGEGSIALAITLAFICGAIALVLMAFVLKGLIKLQTNGNLQLSEAIGSIADVYLTIPSKDKGEGKITLTLDERFIEQPAITLSAEEIKTGTKVKIVNIIGNTYVVEKL